MLLSVVICTHNPRPKFFERVLRGLREQTLPASQWELVLIDNASSTPLTGNWDLSWHPHSRHIREDKLGVVFARRRGMTDTKSPILTFVDDDNVLAPDYLSRTVEIAQTHPMVGSWGGSITPEFEAPPPPWIHAHLSSLAAKEVDRDYIANFFHWTEATPFGAGLCLRRTVADQYLRQLAENPLRLALGRAGKRLGAGEDTDIAWCAIDIGLLTARFHSLKITHLIPREKLEPDYIIRLHAGLVHAEMVRAHIRGIPIPPKTIWSRMRSCVNFFTGGSLSRGILLASRKSEKETCKFLREYTASKT